MAYKFQLGDARLSGSTVFEQALAGESTISASSTLSGQSLTIDSVSRITKAGAATLASLNNSSGGITNAGSIAGATTIDASGDLTVGTITMAEFTVAADGDTDIDGTLNVEGVPTFQAAAVFSGGITTANAIAGATTVSGSGQFSMSHIDLDGTLNAGGKVTVVGVSDLDGGIDVNASKFTVSTAGAVVADSTVSGAAGTFDALAGTSLALQSGGITAAGAIAGASTISGSSTISGHALDIETSVSASSFWGSGAGLTNISAGSISAAGSDKQVQFNQNGDFAATAGMVFNGSGSLILSGTSSGMQSSELAFGTSGTKYGSIYVEDDGGYLLVVKNENGGIDLSGSDGVAMLLPDGQNLSVANGVNMNSAITIGDDEGGVVAAMSGSGMVSGSATAKFHALESGQGKFTVSAAGAVVVDSIKTDGNEFVVSTAGLVTATGIANSNAGMTNVGSIAGATTVSGSGNFNIGGTLNADNLGSATVSLTDDLMIIDDGASGAIKTTSLANYATAIAGAGMTSTAGALNVIASSNAGIDVAADAIKLDLSDLAAGAVNVAADSIAIIDADDSSKSKKESIADLVTAMAGTGITATNGVLSISSVSTPTAFGSYATLVEGLNYANVTLTGATELNLPAASALENGEYVKIKMAAGVSSTNTVTVNVGNGSDSIDGDSSIVLESPYAAVDLYRVAANTWRIM
jgi:hypothetical protein